jgi:dynein heavy chain
VFKLQHLLDCHILQHREELEEITTAAVKEEQIETKLAGIESDWVALNLVSAQPVCFEQLHIRIIPPVCCRGAA